VLDHPAVSRCEAAPCQLASEVDDVGIVGSKRLRQQDVILRTNDVPPLSRCIQRNVWSEEAYGEKERLLLRLGQSIDRPGGDPVVALLLVPFRKPTPVPKLDSLRIIQLLFRKRSAATARSVLLKRLA
jgi:hypothetical protein